MMRFPSGLNSPSSFYQCFVTGFYGRSANTGLWCVIVTGAWAAAVNGWKTSVLRGLTLQWWETNSEQMTKCESDCVGQSKAEVGSFATGERY